MVVYENFYRCLIEKDLSGLQALLDDSFVLIHMTGMRQNKQSFIQSVADGTLNYFSEVCEHVQLKEKKDTAQLIGQSLVQAAVFGGGRHTWHLQLNMWLVRCDGQWRVSETVASTY